jgi:acyl-CoA dehydrogenase
VDFSLSERVVQWQRDIRAFVDDVVIPREQEAFARGVTEDLRRDLQGPAGGGISGWGRVRFR